eukprot:TRINITY_DN8045_c9_g1_i1.p1 TRINITY_DN8045_c9_g1~~TRINITY_DN8045_c9_g1_i1.p1  ORF type:complete len:794 (+),score=252.93 TRINITY_DN8045_c9_g1_i1:87-2468(+)
MAARAHGPPSAAFPYGGDGDGGKSKRGRRGRKKGWRSSKKAQDPRTAAAPLSTVPPPVSGKPWGKPMAAPGTSAADVEAMKLMLRFHESRANQEARERTMSALHAGLEAMYARRRGEDGENEEEECEEGGDDEEREEEEEELQQVEEAGEEEEEEEEEDSPQGSQQRSWQGPSAAELAAELAEQREAAEQQRLEFEERLAAARGAKRDLENRLAACLSNNAVQHTELVALRAEVQELRGQLRSAEEGFAREERRRLQQLDRESAELDEMRRQLAEEQELRRRAVAEAAQCQAELLDAREQYTKSQPSAAAFAARSASPRRSAQAGAQGEDDVGQPHCSPDDADVDVDIDIDAIEPSPVTAKLGTPETRAAEVPPTPPPDPEHRVGQNEGGGFFTHDLVYVCLDFEATCESGVRDWQHEIIEFPAVAVCGRTWKILGEFHRYVRPVDRPRLTNFCKSFTGITQQQVDSAQLLGTVIAEFDDWVRKRLLLEDNQILIVTDGDHDLFEFLWSRSIFDQGKLACGDVKSYMRRWVDCRQWFKAWFVEQTGYQMPPMRGKPWILRMLGEMGMQFEGRQHSGICDARNVARIVQRLLSANTVPVTLRKVAGLATQRSVFDIPEHCAPLYVATSELLLAKSPPASPGEQWETYWDGPQEDFLPSPPGEPCSPVVPLPAAPRSQGVLVLNKPGIYEGKDKDGCWWGVTLRAITGPETVSAGVHDYLRDIHRVHKEWPVVHRANLRLSAEQPFALAQTGKYQVNIRGRWFPCVLLAHDLDGSYRAVHGSREFSVPPERIRPV